MMRNKLSLLKKFVEHLNFRSLVVVQLQTLSRPRAKSSAEFFCAHSQQIKALVLFIVFVFFWEDDTAVSFEFCRERSSSFSSLITLAHPASANESGAVFLTFRV